MITSKVAARGRTTIPKAIRDLLHIEPGDLLAYGIENGSVSVRKFQALDATWQRTVSHTLTEWDSPEDDEAFRDL